MAGGAWSNRRMRDVVRKLRTRAWGAVILGALMIVPLRAHAGEDDDETDTPKRRGLVVTVEDNDDVDAAPPRAKKRGDSATAPDDGASESEINAYLRGLKKDVRDTQIAAKQAARAGDADEAIRLKEELRDKKAFLKDEERRLTSRDVGLIAGGGVLTGLGSLSLLSSVVLIFVYAGSSIDGNPEDEYGWASLATLGGGVLGLSAGIPMIAVGSRRGPRESDDVDTYGREQAPTGHGPAVGFTMSLSF
jgi:hypothetical protein